MARHQDDAWPQPATSPTGRGSRPDPADLLTGPASSTAQLSGGTTAPAFGYPEFAPAEAGDYEFRAQYWHLGETGFEQIGDADVIRRGLGKPAVTADGRWDPLTDPWPTTAQQDTEALDMATDVTPVEPAPPATDATQPVELWGDVAVRGGHLDQRTQPVDLSELFRADPILDSEHPSGPLPQAGAWPPPATVPDTPAGWLDADVSKGYDATLSGPLGRELGFRDGQWYALLAASARKVSAAEALRLHPELAGQITHLICWWIRRNPMSDRALDLASELAIGVAELARGEAHQHI
jgi:hypothetical protein